MQFKDCEEQKDFELWAFGHVPTIYGEPLMHTWNSRHGDKCWFKTDELIKDSMKKMYELYVKEHKEQSNDPQPSQA